MSVKSGDLVTQVKLVQDIIGGWREDVCWVEHRYAKMGKLLRAEDGQTWYVQEIYGSREVTDLIIAHRAWKRWADVLDGH